MASRSPHVDVCVNERRLRPIYDCLDNSNNKKALQEAEKLLKKQKDLQCAKVLKALALIRLGRQDEAVVVLKEVHDEIPTDDPTLQAMTICYRELHKPELIADAYEGASKREPQNEEFMTHLFMAYVRIGDYKKQQQVAMSLYKLKPKNPYYFWAVMSIVMQAHNADEMLSKSMLLPLAQRMTEKFIAENKIEAEAEVQLYMMILELQGKYAEALAVMDGSLGERLTPYLHYNSQRRAELLTSLHRWQEANSTYRTLLLENPDQWLFYVEYFRSGFVLHDQTWHPDKDCKDTEVDYTSSMMADFVLARVLVEEAKSSRCLRGPFLARLELLRQLKERRDDVAQTLGTCTELILAYFDKFGDRGCFFDDMQPFLFMLNSEESSVVLDKILHCVSNENECKILDAKTEKELQKHVNYIQLCEYLGRHNELLVEEKCEVAFDLVRRYNNYLEIDKNLLPTDHHPADLYCILASHLLINVWRETGDYSLIWQPIVLLEKGMKNSPHNHQMKLLLIKLYNCLGAIEISYTLYESLDVKHIQQDTLGYLVTRHLAAKGAYSQACCVFSNTLKFFMANHKDTVDYLISSYKFGSFTKINEFVKFRERLNNSLQYAVIAVERMILDVLLEVDNHSSSEKIIAFLDIDLEKDKPEKWEDLRDNRDMMVLVGWERLEKDVLNESIANSFRHEVEWLKFRNLLIRSLATAYLVSQSVNNAEKQSSNSELNGERRSVADIMRGLLDQLREAAEQMKSIEKTPINGSFLLAEPSRLDFYAEGVYLEVLVLLEENVLYLNSLTDHGMPDKAETIYDDANQVKIAKLLQDAVNQQINDASSQILMLDFAKWPRVLENFANLAETLSFAAVFAGFCQRILKPVKNALTRKGKKKKNFCSAPMPQTFSNFNAMLTGLETATTNLRQCLQELSNSIVLSELSNISLNDHVLPREEKDAFLLDIQKRVEKSYLQSLKEIEELVNNKIKYFASLRL